MKSFLIITGLAISPIIAVEYTATIDQLIPATIAGEADIFLSEEVPVESISSGSINVTSVIGAGEDEFGNVVGNTASFSYVITRQFDSEVFIFDGPQVSPTLPLVTATITSPDNLNDNRVILHTRVDKGYSINIEASNFKSDSTLPAAREVRWERQFTHYDRAAEQNEANGSTVYIEAEGGVIQADSSNSRESGTYEDLAVGSLLGSTSPIDLDIAGEEVVEVFSLPIEANTYEGNVFLNDVDEQSLAQKTIRVFPLGTAKIINFNNDALIEETEPYVTTPPFNVTLRNIYPGAEVTVEVFNHDTNELINQVHFRPAQETMLYELTTEPFDDLTNAVLPDGKYRVEVKEHLIPFDVAGQDKIVEEKARKIYTIRNSIRVNGSVNSSN